MVTHFILRANVCLKRTNVTQNGPDEWKHNGNGRMDGVSYMYVVRNSTVILLINSDQKDDDGEQCLNLNCSFVM